MKRLLAFAVLLCVVGCLPVATDAPMPKVNPGPVVEGNTRFALDLFQQLRTEKGNLFFSPYSISSALAMTLGGAREETAAEMKKTLAFPEDDKLNGGFYTLNAELNGEQNQKRGYKLTVANSLWGQANYSWNADFLASSKKFYGAGLQEVDFRQATEQARQTINGWVEKQTQDTIKELLKPGILKKDSRLVLTNAIYFKGDWASQFKKDLTRDQPFRMDEGKTAKVPMMYQQARFGYGETPEAQILRMPYVGKELEMVAVLPKKVGTLAEVEKSLDGATLTRWLGATRVRDVQVLMPKFKMETDFSLGDVLKKMGMPLAFDEEKANFKGLSTQEQLYIAAVIHKAFVEVNEVGTEAAAATAVIIATVDVAIRIDPVPVFRADHPFLFLIRDTRNGSVLFLGRLATP